MMSMAPSGVCGNIRCLARPLPEPAGMMPSAVGDSLKARATSLTVPSPPTATTISTPSSTKDFVSSAACPEYSVKTVLTSYFLASMCESIRAGMPSLLAVPDMGLIMNDIFFKL